jgi:hypothetical protein
MLSTVYLSISIEVKGLVSDLWRALIFVFALTSPASGTHKRVNRVRDADSRAEDIIAGR